MSDREMPDAVRRVLLRLAAGDRSTLLGLHAILRAADDRGIAKLHDAAIQYRDDTLAAMRADGRDVDREAGLLSIDQATANLLNTVLPRLVPEGLIVPGTRPGDDDGQPVVTVAPVFIGDGIPLIARRHRHVPLELRSVERFEDGMVQLRYRVLNELSGATQYG